MSGVKTYVLMVTSRRIVMPMLAPATEQGVIEATCQFETFPAAVSDDVSELREGARRMCERFPTIESWNVVEVPVIGGVGDAD